MVLKSAVPMAGKNRKGATRERQVDIKAGRRNTRGAIYGALRNTASPWEETIFSAVFIHVLYMMTKSDGHTLLNEVALRAMERNPRHRKEFEADYRCGIQSKRMRK
jgi:hypothetical protein